MGESLDAITGFSFEPFKILFESSNTIWYLRLSGARRTNGRIRSMAVLVGRLAKQDRKTKAKTFQYRQNNF